MEESAQKEIIQQTDQQTTDLHKKVAGNVEQITGDPISLESLNPKDQSSFKKLKETGAEILDVAHSVGTSVGEKLGGEVDNIRVIETRKPSLISRFRSKIKIWK